MNSRELTSWQRRRLERQLEQTHDARLYRRTLTLQALAEERPGADIAALLRVTRQSVYNWVEAYTSEPQPQALADDDLAERPRRLGEDEEAVLRALLARSPQELDYPDVSWTVPLLRHALYLDTGQWFSGRTVPGPSGGSGTSGNGSATSLPPTRSARKKRRIRRQIRALPPRSVVLAEDETDLLLFPPLRAGWSRRGEAAKVRLSGRNARRVIFGALNLPGARLFLERQRQRSGDFQAFLDLVDDHYRGWHVALLLDEDPCHTAGASLRRADGMTLLWLPHWAPELNLMDTLWGQGKDVVSANYQYPTIDDHVEEFLVHLYSLSNRAALHTAGIRSENFWLRDVLSKNLCPPA